MPRSKFDTRTLSVDKGEIAYLQGNNDGYISLEADIHNPGYAVALRNSETGSVALIHGNDGSMELISGFNEINETSEINFDEAVVVSAEESDANLGWVLGYLRKRVERVEGVIKLREPRSLGIDSTGFYFPTNPKEINVNKESRKLVRKIKR